MKRGLTPTQAAELIRAARTLPPASRDAFFAAVDARLCNLSRRLTDGDVQSAIVATLGDTTITTTQVFLCDAAPTPRRPTMARTRYDNDDDDAFDHNGLLRDGKRTRVPLMLRDAMSPIQRAIMDAKASRFDYSQARHQPGPVFTDAAGLERKARAYAEMCDDLQNTWRNPSPLAAPAAAAALPLRRDTAPARPVYDAAEARRIKAAAYAEMVDEMTSAWKGPTR